MLMQWISKVMFATHDTFNSYVDLYRHRAEKQANELAYVFLENGEDQENKITFGYLHRQALIVAASIREFALAFHKVDFIFTY